MTKIIIQIIKEGSLYCEYIVATSWLTSLNLIDFQGRQQQKTSGMAFIFWLLQCLKALLQPSPNCVVLTYIIRLSQQKELIELSLCVVNFLCVHFYVWTQEKLILMVAPAVAVVVLDLPPMMTSMPLLLLLRNPFSFLLACRLFFCFFLHTSFGYTKKRVENIMATVWDNVKKETVSGELVFAASHYSEKIMFFHKFNMPGTYLPPKLCSQ